MTPLYTVGVILTFGKTVLNSYFDRASILLELNVYQFYYMD